MAATVVVFGLLAGGCSGGTAPDVTPNRIESSSASSVDGGSSGLRVTVPSLSRTGEPTVPSSGVPSAVPATSVESGDAVGTVEQPAASAVASVATVAVELVGCEGCEVLATAREVVPGISAALIRTGERAALLSVDGAGAVLGILNIPYGVSFPAPARGELACRGGRCVVVAAVTDASAVLSSFSVDTAGAWTDESGDSGFVSATAKGMPVEIEDTLGIAIQVSDGTTTVWTVLVWSGTAFTTLGCAPDSDRPELSALTTATCPS